MGLVSDPKIANSFYNTDEQKRTLSKYNAE